MAKSGFSLGQIDLHEVNEAFAPQVLAVLKELDLPVEAVNKSGGSIAMAHPPGITGARLLGHMAHQLANSNGTMKTALASACIGGGQGIAVLLEKV